MSKEKQNKGRPIGSTSKDYYDCLRMKRAYDMIVFWAREAEIDGDLKDIEKEIAKRMQLTLNTFFHANVGTVEGQVAWLAQLRTGSKSSVHPENLWALIYSLWEDFYEKIEMQKNIARLDNKIAGAICARMHYAEHWTNFDEVEKIQELCEIRGELKACQEELKKLQAQKRKLSKTSHTKRKLFEIMLADKLKTLNRKKKKWLNTFEEKKEALIQKRGYGIYSVFFDEERRVPSTEWLFDSDFAIDIAEMLDKLCNLKISIDDAERLAHKIDKIFEDNGLSNKTMSSAAMEFNSIFGVTKEAVFKKIILEIFGTVYTQRFRFKTVSQQ